MVAVDVAVESSGCIDAGAGAGAGSIEDADADGDVSIIVFD